MCLNNDNYYKETFVFEITNMFYYQYITINNIYKYIMMFLFKQIITILRDSFMSNNFIIIR